mmetsp:Transcript_2775/g.4198  ORF Transcript_2775/g.4198 Transcript_2775/m.4198 type:complete len:85 (-) Transcript_2775:2284-2538(-)
MNIILVSFILTASSYSIGFYVAATLKNLQVIASMWSWGRGDQTLRRFVLPFFLSRAAAISLPSPIPAQILFEFCSSIKVTGFRS